jgi:hypothetical protein
MPATDAPDWQTIITLQSGGALTDAPDWTDVVTGPGGTQPISGGGGGTLSYYFALGYLGVTCDPTVTNNGAAHTAGQIALNAFIAFSTASANFITMYVTSGSSVTANQNYVGIYDAGQTTPGSATRLGVSAAGACDAVFNSTGLHKIALSAPVALTGGAMYYAAFLNNGGTPSFQNCSLVNPNTSVINPLGTTLPVRFDPAGSFTTFPSTAAFAGSTLQAGPWLMFVS